MVPLLVEFSKYTLPVLTLIPYALHAHTAMHLWLGVEFVFWSFKHFTFWGQWAALGAGPGGPYKIVFGVYSLQLAYSLFAINNPWSAGSYHNSQLSPLFISMLVTSSGTVHCCPMTADPYQDIALAPLGLACKLYIIVHRRPWWQAGSLPKDKSAGNLILVNVPYSTESTQLPGSREIEILHSLVLLHCGISTNILHKKTCKHHNPSGPADPHASTSWLHSW